MKLSKVRLILIGTLAVFVASLVTSYIGQLVIDTGSEGTKNINEQIGSNYWMILLPLLFSPIVEEVIFRKWLPNVFSDVIGRKKSILFSNALFSFLHFNIYFVPFLVNGLIYSYFYEKAKDIKIPIAIHIFYNGVVFLLTHLL